MKNYKNHFVTTITVFVIACSMTGVVAAQQETAILSGRELTRVIPPGFYFQGLSAPTQLRNSAAVRFGHNRYVLAGLVDTSGYAADVRAKYEGFLISDSSIAIGGSELGAGAYGFGFGDGKLIILDLAGNQVLSVSTTRDTSLKRPRPLAMIETGSEIRLYSGKDYAVITAR